MKIYPGITTPSGAPFVSATSQPPINQSNFNSSVESPQAGNPRAAQVQANCTTIPKQNMSLESLFELGQYSQMSIGGSYSASPFLYRNLTHTPPSSEK